jgi:acetolactate synthase regulatory subunit
MKQNLECEIDQTEGSLIRMLGVIERRGYKLDNLNVQPLSKSIYNVQFCVHSERDINILMKQLERLVDVRSVRRVDLEQTINDSTHAASYQMHAYQASWLAS